MARKNKRYRSSVGRDFKTPPIASLRLPRLFNPLFSRPLPMPDNRHHFPLPRFRVESVMRNRRTLAHTVAPVRTKLTKNLTVKHSFAVPVHATPCVRRKRRKEVLHALRYAGRRFGSGGSYRRNENSRFSC